MLYDFSNCKLSHIAYGGSEKKLGILIGSFPYMLKFQKRTAFGIRHNIVSEYIGSHVYQMLGIDCQDTILGTYNGEYVVACKDFVTEAIQFVPFNEIGESTIDENKERFQYSYEDIMFLLNANKKLTNVNGTISMFFDIFIIDALLGNFDRHGNNWGFLKKENRYSLAPVFDNGSCLYPNMIDEHEMEIIIKDDNQINQRVFGYPTSQIKLNGKKSSYFEVISSLQFDEINKALERIFPLIDLKRIFALIDGIVIISEIHKEFYKTMIEHRYRKILEHSYLKLKGIRYENI